ncbi:MAG TPA: hypothetical protein VGT98_11215 [Candidatus Elarobacter sp.]|nr:hypothetical protein [Candidatus Elarobacter sp.]
MKDPKDKQKKQKQKNAADEERERAKKASNVSPNPPRTTTGRFTAPKFGSAGSGGAEFEPGPERD